MEKTSIIILAAGLGKRLGAPIAKVLAKACDRPLISYLLETLDELNADEVIVVTGHQREVVEEFIIDDIKTRNFNLNVLFAHQDELLGTGHATMCALKSSQFQEGRTIILCGDAPLIKKETLENLIKDYASDNAILSVLSFDADKNSSYGRIIRDDEGNFVKIVEKKDCTPQEAEVTESNSGVYCVNTKFLRDAVTKIKTNNAQKEYYLTDIVKIASDDGLKVIASKISNEEELQGVNTKEDLEKVEATIKKSLNL